MKQHLRSPFPKTIALGLFLAFLIPGLAHALTFPLPPKGNNIVGKVQTAFVHPGDNFHTVGRRYDVGYYEMVEANPRINPNHPKPWTTLVIPTEYILPPAPRKGIVINLAELRLYYYPPKGHVVMTFPVGIGRQDWPSPRGLGHIVHKIYNPTWYVPESIRAARAAQGVYLPRFVLPGPKNPLGHYAMPLSFKGYLLHSTNEPTGVGMRSSSGCIRLFPENMKVLFGKVRRGTSVRILDLPYKIGWEKGKVYLEAHLPFQEDQNAIGTDYAPMVKAIITAITGHKIWINWKIADQVAGEHNGIPQLVGWVRPNGICL